MVEPLLSELSLAVEHEAGGSNSKAGNSYSGSTCCGKGGSTISLDRLSTSCQFFGQSRNLPLIADRGLQDLIVLNIEFEVHFPQSDVVFVKSNGGL